uniref:Uncharacterized protein n=1 Tax=Fagus sylvatica TaxID=28930 RepID=A0A2N9FJM3_FAGSY
MRGGRVGFIENRARLAQHHHARRMTVLRELWYCHVAVLSFHASSPSNPPRFPCAYPFLSDFRGQFWRSSGTQTGSCGISSESSRRPLSNDIKFARIGVRTRELWLPEVGVSELFSCTLPMRRFRSNGGCYSANREFHDVAGVIIFPTHPGSRINLLRAGKTLRAKAAVREKKCVLLPARFFSNLVPVPDSRESELGLVRYGPASRVHRGVFGPFEGSFPIRIPADPDKFLAIREFHVVHGCVLFPMCPGSQINLLRVRKTLCASAATSALHRGELGFARYDPANGGRRNVPYAKGGGQFDPVFGLVNGPVKPWSNLVNLGQTWSDLVKALQTLGNVPRTSFQGFLGKADPSRAGNSSVKPRSNFGQPSQTWSTLVKLGQTLGNVSRTFFLGVFDAESPRRIRPAWFGLSRFARRHSRKSRGSSGTQNGSCGISSESSRRPLSNDIKFARIGVRTRELWLPEVGVSELFLCTLPMRFRSNGGCFGEPRVPRRSRSHYLSNAPGLEDQLVASRKDSAREGGSPDVRFRRSWYRRKACAAYFCKVPDLRKSELGLVRYGPANRGHRSVFGPFEGSFPIGIPADPDKILGDPRVPRRAWMCLLSNVPGLAGSTCCESGRLCAQAWQRRWEIPELSAKPYFVGLFSRAWPCTEASFGFARYDPANGGRRNVPYAKGGGQFDPVFGLVNGPVKPWSNLVNLGQTWSNWSKLSKLLEMYPGLHFKGFWARQTWSNLGKCVSGPSSWEYLMRDEPSSDQADLVRAASFCVPTPEKIPGFVSVCVPVLPVQMGIPGLGEDRSGCEKTIGWFDLGTTQAANRVVSTVWNLSPNKLRSDLTWGLPRLQIGRFQRCKSGMNRPGPPRSRNEVCDPGPNRFGPPSPRNGDELGTNRPGPPRSRNEICDSGPNRSGPPSPRNGDELGTNRPSPSSPRNGDELGTNRPVHQVSKRICDSGPNRSGPPSPRNGDELGTNRPSPSRSRNGICDSGPNRSGPPSPRNGDELGTNRPSPSRCLIEVVVAGAIAGLIALRKARL